MKVKSAKRNTRNISQPEKDQQLSAKTTTSVNSVSKEKTHQGDCNLGKVLTQQTVGDNQDLTRKKSANLTEKSEVSTNMDVQTQTTNKADDHIKAIIDPVIALHEGSSTTQPKSMDLKIVIQMFKEIKQELKTYKEKTSDDRIDGIIHQQELDGEELTKMKEELRIVKVREQAMGSMMQGMCRTIKDMDKRIGYLEKENNKKNVVISGLELNEKWEDRKLQIQNLIWDILNVNTEVQDSYFVGTGEIKTTIVTFVNERQKLNVLQNKKSLAGVTNSSGKGIYINDYQPPQFVEQKRRENYIYNENDANTANKVEMNFF